MKFKEFNFSQKVLDGIKKAGFMECMTVQEKVFDLALVEKRDVMVQSQTGSGKTAAFLLTIFELFQREKEKNHKALIIAPTRELAVQIEQESRLFGSALDYKIGCFYGGAGYGQQEKMLAEGPDIIIGTPGRLLDFASKGTLALKDVDMLIIDEADRMFDMGFLPDLKKILRKTSKRENRQTMLFSATLSTRVSRLAWEYMNNAEEIVINPENLTVQEINQVIYHVTSNEKMALLLGILRREKPGSALIFTNTKNMAVTVTERLSANGFQAEYIMGDLPQKKRLRTIDKIKEGRLDILVATDVAARGLHIDDLEMVINYDVPEDPENYVHRIGRTARAGKSGKAVTLACERFVYGLEPIEELIEMKIPVERPGNELFDQEDKSSHMRFGPSRNDRSRNDRSRPGRSSRSDRSNRSSRPDRSSRSDRSSQSDRQGRSRGGKEQQSQTPRENTSPKDTSRKETPRAETAKDAATKAKAPRELHKGEKNSPAPVSVPDTKKPGREADLKDRLAYYREKYGEDFQLTDRD